MKTGWHILVPVFVVFYSLSIFSVGRIYDMHSAEKKSDFSRLIDYPDSIIKVIVFEFPGLVADYLMLNVMTWHGERLPGKVDVIPEEWQYIIIELRTAYSTGRVERGEGCYLSLEIQVKNRTTLTDVLEDVCQELGDK